MNDPLITEARALLELREKVHPGPWLHKRSPFDVINLDHGELETEIVSGTVLIAALYSDGPDAAFIAASHRMADCIASLLKELEACRADVDKLGEALHQLRQWARAYPLSVFPEPDFARAHEVLKANGMTIDAISASNMRHVITQVIGIVDAAISTKEQTNANA